MTGGSPGAGARTGGRGTRGAKSAHGTGAGAARGALSHIRVLDLSRILAGPWATQMLGDLGADIIKVERPRRGDDTRSWGPPFVDEITGDADRDAAARSAYYCSVNRNKRSLAIDIASSEGGDILRQLAAGCDVLVENFKVGGLARHGLDYETLRGVNPGLVYCSITGFGQDGPDAARAGYDFMIQGMGGLMSVTGEPDGAPMKIGVALVDVLTGTNAATAILAALVHAQRTGQGQHIDMSLFDVSVASLANQALNYLVSGTPPGRLGNAHPNIVPYQAFATARGHIILAVGNDTQFAAFCRIAGLEGFAEDARFATNSARVINRDALTPHIGRAFAAHPAEWWLDRLGRAGVPAGPINAIDAVLDTPQARHRGLVSQIEDGAATGGGPGAAAKSGGGARFAKGAGKTSGGARGRTIPTIASPLRLGETPPRATLPPPRLGAHSREILAGALEMDDQSIERLLESGVIAE